MCVCVLRPARTPVDMTRPYSCMCSAPSQNDVPPDPDVDPHGEVVVVVSVGTEAAVKVVERAAP